jgi:hypothetical protein
VAGLSGITPYGAAGLCPEEVDGVGGVGLL